MSETVIVTGIGSGIGFATAKMLLESGYRVLGLDQTRGRYDELSQGDYSFVEMDVRDELGQCRAFEKEAREHVIAGLVCCAGIIQRKPYLELDEDTFDRHLDINLKGPFLGCRAIVPIMRKQGKGSIVLFASSIARSGSATAAHYAATKGGILGLCRTLALETAREGIRVNVVSPGVTDTPQPRGHSTDEQLYAKATKVPLGRIGQPDDMASTVLFLLSEDSSYITGQDIRVTGGAGLF
jgi:NAD(P)-dependent dehydrogenase (short-subunit alcohol dehydrogenase family)